MRGRAALAFAFAVFVFAKSAAQDAPVEGATSWNFLAFGVNAPGNGYFFSWDPSLTGTDWRISLRTGYGQAYDENKSFLETLLYRGGIGLSVGNFFADVNFAKDFTRLEYAFYGSQTGVDGRVGLRLGSGMVVQNYAFYGEFRNKGLVSNDFFYDEVSVFGSLYSAYSADLTYRMDLSFFPDPDQSKTGWGVLNQVLFEFGNRTGVLRLAAGYVEQGPSGLGASMAYDFSVYAPGVPSGTVTGNSFIVSENRFRVFPLSRFTRIPFVSDMLYIGAIASAGAFLGKDRVLEDAVFPWYLGGGVGLLFFKLDMDLTYGYSPDSGWVLKFMMKSISLDP